MSIRESVIYYIKKNIFIFLVLISLCPILALSYAKFTINSESYRSNEMYISELLYSIKIDNENTYTLDVEPGETEHVIEITSLSGISTNYKLAYLNNDDLEVKYASDYMDTSFGGIIMTRTISLTIKNTSTEKQILSLMVFGGYSFNEVDEVKVLDTYTEIDTNYLHYDYETTALYVDNVRVDKLEENKYYSLKNYTCNNDAKVKYDTKNSGITIYSRNQTKCSLYFEEVNALSDYLILNYNALGLTKISQSVTGNQNYATTEYRYQGKEPNNYITFNDEEGVWRIIGVFEAETPNDDGTYKKEYKVKIIRDSVTTMAWNTAKSNDWTSSALKSLLNNGEYYMKNGNYSNSGLTENAKNQISSTKWYLGSIIWSSGYGNTKEEYVQERSTSVPSGNKQTWDGKVALAYPTDYMYASSSCYNDDTMKGYNSSNSSKDYRNDTCKSTNWLFISSPYWTLSPASDTSSVMHISSIGYLYGIDYSDTTCGIRPVLYIDPSVSYIGGSGTIDDPFKIN